MNKLKFGLVFICIMCQLLWLRIITAWNTKDFLLLNSKSFNFELTRAFYKYHTKHCLTNFCFIIKSHFDIVSEMLNVYIKFRA